MNLKIACKNPNRCSFDCLNCPYDNNINNPNYISQNIVNRTFDFNKAYKEIIKNDK